MAPKDFSAESLLEAARSLAPQIAAASDQVERDRRLPDHLVAAMADAGLFRMLVPRSLGGAEVPLRTMAEVMEVIARADGSTAWCLGQATGCSITSGFLPRETAREIFEPTRTIVAWGPGVGGKAVEAGGGFRVTGRWSFASGSHHATWLGTGSMLHRADGQPRMRPDGSQEARLFLVPAAEVEFFDTWQVSGLRGTGSDTYTVTDLYVPVERSVSVPWECPQEPGPLYVFPSGGISSVYAIAFSSVALGLARATLDAFVDLAVTKTPRGFTGLLRENGVVQSQLAQAEATVRSARLLLHRAVDDAWEAACHDGAITLEHRISIRMATTNAIHRSAGAVDTAYQLAGATAVFESNPFERRFRDIHAVTQQMQGRPDHFETVGRFLLGLEPETSWL